MKQISNRSKKDEIKERAELDFLFFVRLVQPKRVLGSIHEDVGFFWTRPEKKTHQLLLMPRDHQKSALAGFYAAWEITRNPAIRILYISSTSTLAVKQLKFIKDILTCSAYRRYWPDMINLEEAKREKWTESEISVDHPLRREEIIRDPTVFTAGLTTNITGLHFDLTIFDDVVTKETAYTEEGREKVRSQYSLLASIESADACQIVVGTRYHPKDLYQEMIDMEIFLFDKEGNELPPEPFYEVRQYEVEDQGDGRGQFLWPKQQRSDGKYFGFDSDILARKYAQYLDKTQFRAQYYNDPNDISAAGITSELFQYYEKQHLTRVDGKWMVRGRRLNVYAAIDFAYSLRPEADYSTVIVVGIDSDLNYFVLDIDRFKTALVSEYYKHILALHQKWDFRKIRAEVTVAQKSIVETLKTDWIRRDGLALVVDDDRPTGKEGTKGERIFNTLQPRYANRQMWHYRGGNCSLLEEELQLQNPKHDDIKDALTSVIPICVAPTAYRTSSAPVFQSHPRFGGIM